MRIVNAHLNVNKNRQWFHLSFHETPERRYFTTPLFNGDFGALELFHAEDATPENPCPRCDGSRKRFPTDDLCPGGLSENEQAQLFQLARLQMALKKKKPQA